MNQPSGLEWKAYIGDQMLFLGKNHSKSILAIGFLAGFKGNCIYYTDDRTVSSFTLVYQHREAKGMFGNCFFPLFSVFKNNFLFFRLKNLFGNSKRAENKNCFQN